MLVLVGSIFSCSSVVCVVLGLPLGCSVVARSVCARTKAKGGANAGREPGLAASSCAMADCSVSEGVTQHYCAQLNVAVARFDDRRIEVIANGLRLWKGAQLAANTATASPLTASGVARSLRDPARPIALQEARRHKEQRP